MSTPPSPPFIITAAETVSPMDTARVIYANAQADTRSAIDQFLEVFNTLNVLLSRRGVGATSSASIDAADESSEWVSPADDADLESLTALVAEFDPEDAEDEEFSEDVTPDARAAGEHDTDTGDASADSIGAGRDVEKDELGDEESPENLGETPAHIRDSSSLSDGQNEKSQDSPTAREKGGTVEATQGKPQAYAPTEDELSFQLNNLVFLGYVSAVESYLRCLTRQLVMADEFTAEEVADQKISFAAATHGAKEFYPEAFLEDMTFISKKAIDELLSNIYGIKAQKLADQLKEYQRICQLRHCIVHRFGKLGSNNAVNLGLRTHAALFGKPIRLTSADLSGIGHTLVNLVKAINNHVYVEVLQRSAKQSLDWQWEFEADKERFQVIYDVFVSKLDGVPEYSCDVAYAAFKATCEEDSATTEERRRNQRAARLRTRGGAGAK